MIVWWLVWRQVKLKLNEMLSSLTLETLARKKHKEAKEASISFRSIIFVKKYILSLFQSNSKTLTKKKKVFVFWRYSKTLK